jgi:DNA-binding NarL/FixJ family response regulator
MGTLLQTETARRIIIADDHPLFRTALSQAVLQALGEPELIMVGCAAELSSLLCEGEPRADLLLLDLNMPGVQGYSSLIHACTAAPSLPVIIISAHEDAGIAQASLEHGAAGFIPKSAAPDTIAEAIGAVLAGGQWLPQGVEGGQAEKNSFTQKLATLTPQQQRVLMMLTDGLLNKQIALDLEISEATVKAHITAILRKLDVHTRTQAVIAARSLEIDWAHHARRELNDSNS